MLPPQFIQRLERFRDPRIPGIVRALEGKSERLPDGTEVRTVYLVLAEPNLFPWVPSVVAEFGLRSLAHAEEWKCDLLFCPLHFKQAILGAFPEQSPDWHPPRPLPARLRQRWEIIRQLRGMQTSASEGISTPSPI